MLCTCTIYIAILNYVMYMYYIHVFLCTCTIYIAILNYVMYIS